jgi:hypothetical protein
MAMKISATGAAVASSNEIRLWIRNGSGNNPKRPGANMILIALHHGRSASVFSPPLVENPMRKAAAIMSEVAAPQRSGNDEWSTLFER